MDAIETAQLLLVEDDEFIGDLLQESLQDAGFTVLLASTGTDAVGVMDGADTPLRGLITDIRLPGAHDGWDIARLARERFPDIAVVYISGDSAHRWADSGVPHSIMIEKPFAPVQVVTAISTLLNAASSQPRPPA